jgi:hypothetical protein
MYIILAQFLFFTYYVIYIWSRYGVQPSISDSWYTVDKGKKWMFPLLFCFVVGFLNVFHADLHPLFFFSGAGLCFTGVAAAFKDEKMTKNVHYIGATAAVGFSMIGLYLSHVQWPIALEAALIFSINLHEIKNKLWWIEVTSFYFILGGLLELYLK